MHWRRLWVAPGKVCLRGGDSLGQRAELSASALPSAMLQRGCSLKSEESAFLEALSTA